MHYPPNLQPGRFLRRVNRFLAEVEVAGAAVSAHVPNSGRNRELFTVGRAVLLTPQSAGPRKTAFDLSLVRFNRRWVSVDARLPNRLVEEAWSERRLPALRRYDTVAREVTLGDSRVDLLFGRGDERCYAEVKSVTLVRHGIALFPDAPTSRGARHLRTLSEVVRSGAAKAAVIFVVQRDEARELQPFREADPEFAEACREAKAAGVKLLAYRCRVTREEIALTDPLPVRLPRPTA